MLKRILMVTVVTFLAELFVREVGGSKLAIYFWLGRKLVTLPFVEAVAFSIAEAGDFVG